jgi:signal transduction histidine kinase
LRTPLTSIRAFSEILYDNPDLPVARRSHFLEIILKESERLTRLINQVLDLAKLEAGAAEWNTDTVDLRDLMRDALASTEQVISDKGIQVEMRAPESVLPVVVDRDRITQVLLNLLSNAIKFCQAEGGVILLTLQVTGDALQVSVHDNGPGISPQEQQRIFDKFRQVHDHTNGKPQGTGLGLPISKQIIAHYGGNLWVESAPGQGAAFCFTLPFRNGSE